MGASFRGCAAMEKSVAAFCFGKKVIRCHENLRDLAAIRAVLI